MTTPDSLFVKLQAALAGEYSLERELGRGGMGVVYLASEVRLAREVAIKVLPPELATPERREQFVREAQMAARLSHPNIVPIHRVDESQGFVYFVMAYIAGETLARRIAERGPLPPHQAVRLLRETAWALTYAHASGLVHRDVKADNILIERGTGRAVVTDFGIASVAHADARTPDGQITGSPHYASPEQIAGQPVDASSDLYSLGVVGFFALTGRLPFDAPTAREVVNMHLTARAPSITSLAPTAPPRVAQLIERCMAKRPENRPVSASAFVDLLEHVIEPSREIPAPLRVWIARSSRGHIARRLLAAYLVLGTGAAITLGRAAPIVVLPLAVALVAGILFGPAFYRTHQVLAAGYTTDDLRVALRQHWMRRREEDAYELSAAARPGLNRLTLATFAVTAGAAVLINTATHPGATGLAIKGLPFLIMTAAVTGGLTFVRFIRRKTSQHLGISQIKFYDGKWGERFVRLAGIGLKKHAPTESLSQLTEVALGRATDALYNSLPKATRKQLQQLPSTIRRLETDAKRLRAEVEKLDASLIALDGDARVATSAAGASVHEATMRTERDRLRDDLRATRDKAANHLAATVAALENIRLDLLRLQLGDGRVDSVTASLDAARDVALDLGAFVDATEEVERSLRPLTRLTTRTSLP